MTNKELDELLKKYAESTRSDKEVSFKKLKEKNPQKIMIHMKKYKNTVKNVVRSM